MAHQFVFGDYVPHIFGTEVEALYRAHVGWVVAAIETTIAWPQKDVMVTYQGDDFFLRGTHQHEDRISPPSIAMRCDYPKGKSHLEALGKMYRFASILGWFERGHVEVTGYVRSTAPILYGDMQTGPSPLVASKFNCNYLPSVPNELARRALAFWRDGERLRRIHPGYAFLSYYKVIETQFGDGKGKGQWINSQYGSLDGDAGKRVKELEAHGIDVGTHIFASCRSAVAHARDGAELIDPDEPVDRDEWHLL